MGRGPRHWARLQNLRRRASGLGGSPGLAYSSWGLFGNSMALHLQSCLALPGGLHAHVGAPTSAFLRAKSLSCGARQPGFSSWACHLLAG